jgi:DNA-directed RNA polymerase subunit RPC12/RpoP
MAPTRVSPAELDLPYEYPTCPKCGRQNAMPSHDSRFQCLKCGSDVRLDGELTIVERARSRQTRRWITAGVLGAVGLGLYLYAGVREYLVELPFMRRLGIPGWAIFFERAINLSGQYPAVLPMYLGLALLAAAAATAYRAYRRA